MRVSILASGSSGNCTLVEANGATIIIDAGIPARIARLRLKALHRRLPPHIDAVLVTHTHGDHARYAQVLQRSFDCTLYVTESTRKGWDLFDAPGVKVFPNDEPFKIGSVHVSPLPLSHDTPQVGLRIDDGEQALGIATDLGITSPQLVNHLSGCPIVLLECNHDPTMLANGPYPPFLKKRVSSALGHLSNDQAAKLLTALPKDLRHVVLMHISEKNNDPQIALKTARRALKGRGVRLYAAKQREPLCIGALPSGQLELGFG